MFLFYFLNLDTIAGLQLYQGTDKYSDYTILDVPVIGYYNDHHRFKMKSII